MQRLSFLFLFFFKGKKYKIGLKDTPKRVLRLCRTLTSESLRANKRRQDSAITDSSAMKNMLAGGRQQV